MNQSQTMRVPTATTKPTVEIDLTHLSESDLSSLQQKDPFMYHSIPSIHKARLYLKDIDHSTLVAPKAPQASSIVSRKSRVSTECHMDVLLEDLLDLDDEEFMSECQQLQLRPADLLNSSMPPLTSSILSLKSLVSTECHISMLLEDLLDLDDEEYMSDCQ
mmetsp:Transcript_35922/g.65892  ORF Transcript_35922/g.65892 Transcript_35922/m.65892 type:complete len:161 (-) Transcript_35922:164-646(-)